MNTLTSQPQAVASEAAPPATLIITDDRVGEDEGPIDGGTTRATERRNVNTHEDDWSVGLPCGWIQIAQDKPDRA